MTTSARYGTARVLDQALDPKSTLSKSQISTKIRIETLQLFQVIQLHQSGRRILFMAVAGTSVVAQQGSATPYQLDRSQTTKACTALLDHISKERKRRESESTKTNLMAQDGDDEDEDEQAEDKQTPVWLILTTKKHIVDQKRLKPNKMFGPLLTTIQTPLLMEFSPLPHPIHTSATSAVCLITADPQNTYTALLSNPSFPTTLRQRISQIISISNLKKQHGTFEARRQLFASYDLFLADDRIVTYLPNVLGKVFYKGGTKRPIPVSIAAGRERGEDGKRVKLDPASGSKRKQPGDEPNPREAASPEAVAREIEKALGSTQVNLAPGTSTAVRVARAGMSVEHVTDNVEAVTNAMIDKFVTNKWRNVRAVHIKGPETMAVPIWMASELWEDEADVLEEKHQFGKKSKKVAGTDGQAKALPAPEGDGAGKKRKAEAVKKPTAAKHAKKKRKIELDAKMAAETALRKETLKKQKAETFAAAA